MKASRFLGVVLTAALLVGGAVAPVAEAQPSQPAAQTRTDGHAAAYETGAAIANVWYAPGRALVCGGSVLIAAIVMTLTLGQSYDAAAVVARGGCSGPWLVEPADMRRALEQPVPESP